MSIRRLGIMGGTFDPIHYGHLLMAGEAREAFGLEQVVFVPNGQPAHKKGYTVTGAEDRYAMTLLATASNPYFTSSRVEIDRPGPSFAVDTVRWFRDQHPGLEALYFITGADAILEIFSWHNYTELLALCRFIAVTRPGFKLPEQPDSVIREHVEFLPIPGLDISSTLIRNRVRENRVIKYLTTDTVVAYINKRGLYRGKHHGPAPLASDAEG